MRISIITSILISIIVFNIIASCHRSENGKLLKDVDNIIETNPAAAMDLLSNVNAGKLSENEHAYYALLYTQAQIKCGIKVSSDSLIRFAYEYYKDADDGNLNVRACFYKAKVSYYCDKLQDSMKDAIRAYELAKDEEDFYWIAKSAELISDIFFESYNYDQAEIFTKETIENYGLADKTTNQRYSLCDLAIIYLNENKNNQAMTILDSLYSVLKHEIPVDSNLLEYLEAPMIAAIMEASQLQNLKEHDLTTLDNATSNDGIIDNLILKSELYLMEDDLDKSRSVLSKANLLVKSNEQRAHVLFATYQHAKAACDYKKAAMLADTLLSMQSEIAESILKESVTGVQRDFYSNKASEHERKSKQLLIILIVVVIVSGTITILLWWIYRLRVKNKKMELESKATALMYLKAKSERINYQNQLLADKLKEESITVTELKKELDTKSDLQAQNAKIIESLFKEKWATLNMLCNEYFEMGKSENTRTAILNNIEQELNRLRSKKSLKQIEDAVDTYLGGIMACLRKECGFLKEDDFIFLSLVFAGFSVRAVCLFTNIKYKLFYLKKSRLTKRISDSNAPHRDMFLNHIP